jgi:flagellar motor switch protein FliG
MASKKTIVLTMYGKGNTIESISISLFDRTGPLYDEGSNGNAVNYCNNINELRLDNGQWIYASIIAENKKVLLEKPPTFDIINKLNDRAIQKLLRETSHSDLAKALLETGEETKEKIYKNMTRRAAGMLKEDMETLKDVSANDIKSARANIVKTVRSLLDVGEIVFKEI